MTEKAIIEEFRLIRNELASVIKTIDQGMHKSAELTLCKRSLQLSRGIIRISEQLFPEHGEMSKMTDDLKEFIPDMSQGDPYDLSTLPEDAYKNLKYLYDNVRSNIHRFSVLVSNTLKSENTGEIQKGTAQKITYALNDAIKFMRDALIWMEYEAERLKLNIV